MRPALHFLAIGAALFVLGGGLARDAPAVSAPRRAALRAEFARQTGRPPSPAEEAALVDRELDEEILHREALARGLDRDDPAIRARLVEKMRFLHGTEHAGGDDEAALYAEAVALDLGREDPFVRRSLVERMRLLARRAPSAPEPDEAVLAAFLAAHAERFRLPPRVRTTPVFFARDRADPAGDAAAALARLRGPSPPDPATLGDPLAADELDARGLAALLGPDGAAELGSVGTWSGPLASAWGVHLLRLEARDDGRIPALAEVRSRVLAAWRFTEGERAYATYLAGLRRRWGVVGTEGAG
ncbi:MAG: peptidyl-prolyl cis-trans isomerase [bacterium]|nr:peptidyl-prolyl cis-trans isomerase [bacterium]